MRFLLLICFSGAILRSEPDPKFPSGFAVTFHGQDGQGPDVAVLPNVWLFVQNGKSPTPFIPGGKFTAVWNGSLRLDLRGEYAFQAELNGQVKLVVNSKVVLLTNGTETVTVPSEDVKLNKGHNSVSVSYASPPTGDARLRLLWIPKGSMPSPVPSEMIFHEPSAPEFQAGKLRFGRELFLEYRCAKCHTSRLPGSGIIELMMDAPAFDGIGSRLNFEWMVQWILNPKSKRHHARMPQVLHGTTARADAEAAAAFLMSSKQPGSAEIRQAEADPVIGQKLFASLHCAACHTVRDSAEAEAGSISLMHVAQKFAPGALGNFLMKPEEHYAWTRMPNFKLSGEEASQLAAYLLANAEGGSNSLPPTDRAILDRGQKLVQSKGCLNCHSAKLDNHFQTKPLDRLDPTKWNDGCLAEKRGPEAKAPAFGFAPEERSALRELGATDQNSLWREAPAEFAERQVRLLNCAGCHGKLEGVPHLPVLGGKLKPEWARSILAGELPYKPRPWLESRMPAFASRAALLAEGMAAQHGYPPQTVAEPALDQAAAQVGQRLVSADNGFGCIACHAVGQVKATQVFESAGINLAYSETRLLRSYYERWLRNPVAMDPLTKMPAYFDEEGKSPLTDYYDGNGLKQIDAIWQYLRLGERMPPPPGAESGP
ncbi:MAG: c-type cytochrome [Verrucomicrobiales bacterium]|nr:c-type cytochrome [Verrucomicrobiales bacterium]